jgi:nitroreductase
MSEILRIIQDRHSSRVPFDRDHKPSKQDLMQILEAARWAPTAHNMQNFEIIVVDDKKQLEELGEIKSRISEDFLRENYQQLSLSEEELLQKKVGILGAMFPPSWRTPGDWRRVAHESDPSILDQTIKGSPVLMIVTYDPRKRAPASVGDILGFISLGCVMENMWLMAEELGISFQIMSVFGGDTVESEVKKILEIPEYLKIAYAIRLGYPVSKSSQLLRVRRDIAGFAHHNRFGNRVLEEL